MVYEFWRKPEDHKWLHLEKPLSESERQALRDEFTLGIDEALRKMMEGETDERTD